MIYNYKKWLGISFTVLLAMATWSQNFYASYKYNLTPQQQMTVNPDSTTEDYWLDNYTRIWARYHVYGVGILFGWFIIFYRSEGTVRGFLAKSRLREGIVISVCWLVCAVCLFVPIYVMTWCFKVDFSNPDLYNTTNPELKWNAMSGCASTNLSSSMWNASFRIIWGVGVGLLIVLCDLGYGFLIQSFLSAKPFNVIGKMSYCIYMFHYFVVVAYEQSLMELMYIDEFSLAWLFMSILTAAVAVATIAYLFIEMPIATLWSYVMISLLGQNKRKVDQTDGKKNEAENRNKVADNSQLVADSSEKVAVNNDKIAEISEEVAESPKSSDNTTL